MSPTELNNQIPNNHNSIINGNLNNLNNINTIQHPPNSNYMHSILSNPNYSFATKPEMHHKMAEIATDNSICRVIVNNDRLVCFVCENNQCEAMISGVYIHDDQIGNNSNSNKYQITRLNLHHKCSLNAEVVGKCIHSYVSRRSHMKTSEITSRLMGLNYSVGYFETYAFMQHHKIFSPANNTKKNLSNIPNSSIPKMNPLPPLSDIFCNLDFLIRNCISDFHKEFSDLNPSFYVDSSDDFFYFDNGDFIKNLRSVREIKFYNMSHYILILGVMFCSNDEPIISSVFLKHKRKEIPGRATDFIEQAIREFIECEEKSTQSATKSGIEITNITNSSLNPPNLIYLCEFDPVLISTLHLLNKPFFIKSRSLISFLESTDLDQLTVSDYFILLNYPIDSSNSSNMEFNTTPYSSTPVCSMDNIIDIPSENYLRYKCKHKLWFLNNTRVTDFEFINEELCQMDYFDFLNLLIWHIKIDMRERKTSFDDNIISDSVMESIHAVNNNSTTPVGTPLPEGASCDCVIYRECEIPCSHIYNSSRIRNEIVFINRDSTINADSHTEIENISPSTNVSNASTISGKMDPLLHCSKFYYRHQLKNVRNIVSLIDMGPPMYRNLRYKIKMISRNN